MLLRKRSNAPPRDSLTPPYAAAIEPRILFEIVSASALRAWRARDRKRADLQDVAGVAEIVEIYQDEAALHVYRKQADARWVMEAVGGLE